MTADAASFDGCTDEAAVRRSGNSCPGFPWYQGGYPLRIGVGWDSEDEFYACSERNSRGFCEEWTANEEGHDESERGTCFCDEGSANGKFCWRWTCWQIETDKFSTCYKSGTRRKRTVCYREKEAERTDCSCDSSRQPSNETAAMFCESWMCTEIDDVDARQDSAEHFSTTNATWDAHCRPVLAVP